MVDRHGQQNALFYTLVGRTKRMKHIEASFLLILTDSFYLRVAQMLWSQDVAIFMVTTTTDRRQTKPITLPLVHARGVINCSVSKFW